MSLRCADVLARIFGRGLKPEDRIQEGDILEAETRLGAALPSTLRAFYLMAGAAEETRRHNRLLLPDDLVVDGARVVFMEENQGVVDWGVPLRKGRDPVVWQRVEEDPSKWYSERMRFSRFILENLAWQRGVKVSERDIETAAQDLVRSQERH